MAKYKDKIDLYDDRGKLIEKDVPLEAISPLYNPAIKRTVSLAKRINAVDLAALEGALKKAKVGGGHLMGREMDLAIVANGEKIAKRVKDILKTTKDDDTEVSVLPDGKKMIIVTPSCRMDAGVEYTTGFTSAAAALTQAVLDQFDVDMFQASMVKAAIWGRYPQTLNFQGSVMKSILDVPQLNEGAGFA
ncbi:MAG: methyl-coenzyme M reductase subunit beta, partial [Methanomassiliicoccales archaeon]